ncbi:hypothetical protein SAMN05661093_10282 [Kibdelosporangium aridum]|uniref:Uncharacterized protein n=1 Tax=Kibdelosporangium aridum TaxID=2030 RepID=A0A1W2FYJ5_KIBAR|nr:hypothetical protein SAMN05661093_10282 [Kibdelosporangium aridum]
MHSAVGHVLTVYVAVVQVVDVIGVHDGVVPAVWPVGVAVGFGLVVRDRGHGLVPSAVSFLLNGLIRIRASQLGSVTIKPMG